MQDLVPIVSAVTSFIAMLYFLLEFQFTAVRDGIAARLLALAKK